MIHFFNRLFGKSKNPLGVNKTFVIDFVCPNSGEWSELHCIYGLRPFVNGSMSESQIYYIALPREPFWNQMTFHSNHKIPLSIPDNPKYFEEQTLYYKPLKKQITLYVHRSL